MFLFYLLHIFSIDAQIFTRELNNALNDINSLRAKILSLVKKTAEKKTDRKNEILKDKLNVLRKDKSKQLVFKNLSLVEIPAILQKLDTLNKKKDEFEVSVVPEFNMKMFENRFQ